MPIEHANIPDDGRHEPKGASTAPNNYVIVSNGDETTSWKSVDEVLDPSKFKIERVLEAASAAVSQMAVAVDTSVQLEFGPAVFGPVNPVQLDAAGKVTFNVTGLYRIRINTTTCRPAAADVALIIYRPVLNGLQLGRSIAYKVAGEALQAHEQESWFTFVDGDEFTYEFIVDSGEVGTTGGVCKTTPSVAGWNESLSSLIEVDRFVPLGA